MPEATDIQMQVYGDVRIRPFSQRWALIIAQAREHKAAVDDVYARAVGANAWVDARDDGPPHLLQAGNGASPDDFLAFNALITALIALADGTPSTDQEKVAAWNDLQGNLGTLSRAVVVPIGT